MEHVDAGWDRSAGRIRIQERGFPATWDLCGSRSSWPEVCLVLEGVVPEDVNARVLEVLRERTEHKDRDPLADVQHPLVVSVQHYPWKALLSQCFGREPHLKDVLLVPEVRGMIESLVGPNPYYDHHAVHVAGAGMPRETCTLTWSLTLGPRST